LPRISKTGEIFQTVEAPLTGNIRIVKPASSGSFFCNYKEYCRTVLMAIVNADCEFIYLNVGCNRRASDRGVLETTSFYEKLKWNRLNLPSTEAAKENLDFALVRDNDLALHKHLLTPFPARNVTTEELGFNYRLSRARRTADNSFGIMANRF
jgi:hypothetical protein